MMTSSVEEACGQLLPATEPADAAVDNNNNNSSAASLAARGVKLDELKLSLKSLNARCDQFNDVKQSIRQMNDLIKDDLFMDFGAIAMLLRTRLDEMCDKIKERLNDAYSVVRDTQAKLVSKLGDLKNELDELERLQDEYQRQQQPPAPPQSEPTGPETAQGDEEKPCQVQGHGEEASRGQGHDKVASTGQGHEKEALLDQRHDEEAPRGQGHDEAPLSPQQLAETIEQKIKFARDQIDLINNELYLLICGGSGQGEEDASGITNQRLALRGSNSDSLLVENHLYPQFNYYIDTSRVINEINSLYVQLGASNNVNPKVYFFDDPLNENYLNARVATASAVGKAENEQPTPPPTHHHQYIISNNTFDCIVNSSLGTDGSFWAQLIGSSLLSACCWSKAKATTKRPTRRTYASRRPSSSTTSRPGSTSSAPSSSRPTSTAASWTRTPGTCGCTSPRTRPSTTSYTRSTRRRGRSRAARTAPPAATSAASTSASSTATAASKRSTKSFEPTRCPRCRR